MNLPLNSAGSPASLQTVVNLLLQAESLLITMHRNPDGDCVGAANALAAALIDRGKRVTVVSPDPLSAVLRVMPFASAIVTTFDDSSADLIVCVDVSDPALLMPLPAAAPGYFAARASLNIDHHVSNLQYAQMNYVDSTAASTTEIIYMLLHALQAPLTCDSATNLLYGIVNDTHSFQNSNTTARTLEITADLVAHGANLPVITHHLLIARRVSSARLWAQVLPTLCFAADNRIAFLVISQDALACTGATLNDGDGLVEFLRSIEGVEVAVLFKQLEPDHYRLSIRTSALVDATFIAGQFGGGGHLRAAGCESTGSFEDICKIIVRIYESSRTIQAV